jgi:ABC-type nitrate/sulfonate/bicarbonate transport system permease component
MTSSWSFLIALARGVLALIVAAALWEFAARYVGLSFLVPDLATVLGSMAGLYVQADFWTNAGISLWRALAGYAAAAIVGVPIGLALGGGSALRLLLGSLVGALAAAPLIALAPLTTLWFGVGDASKVVLAFVSAVFPLINKMMTGLTRAQGPAGAKSAPASAHARDFGMTRCAVAGLRVAVVPAVGAVLVGEMVGSARGLGLTLANLAAALDTAGLVAVFLVAAMPAIIAVALLRSIELRLP